MSAESILFLVGQWEDGITIMLTGCHCCVRDMARQITRVTKNVTRKNQRATSAARHCVSSHSFWSPSSLHIMDTCLPHNPHHSSHNHKRNPELHEAESYPHGSWVLWNSHLRNLKYYTDSHIKKKKEVMPLQTIFMNVVSATFCRSKTNVFFISWCRCRFWCSGKFLSLLLQTFPKTW